MADYGQIRWDSRVLGFLKVALSANEIDNDPYGLAKQISAVQRSEFEYLVGVKEHLLSINYQMDRVNLNNGSVKATLKVFQQDRADFQQLLSDISELCKPVQRNYPKYCQALVLKVIA